MGDGAKDAAKQAEGFCNDAVVKGLDKNTALVLLIINVLFSGLGTMISACIKDGFKCNVLVAGLL